MPLQRLLQGSFEEKKVDGRQNLLKTIYETCQLVELWYFQSFSWTQVHPPEDKGPYEERSFSPVPLQWNWTATRMLQPFPLSSLPTGYKLVEDLCLGGLGLLLVVFWSLCQGNKLRTIRTIIVTIVPIRETLLWYQHHCMLGEEHDRRQSSSSLCSCSFKSHGLFCM